MCQAKKTTGLSEYSEIRRRNALSAGMHGSQPALVVISAKTVRGTDPRCGLGSGFVPICPGPGLVPASAGRTITNRIAATAKTLARAHVVMGLTPSTPRG